jgi:hypothetical protein
MNLRYLVAVFALLSFPAAAQRAAPTAVAQAQSPVSLTSIQRNAIVESIVAKISERYVFPDRVPAVVAKLKQGLASGRYDTSNPNGFAALVTEDLRAASADRHMYLDFAPAQFAAASADNGGDGDSPELRKLWDRQARRDNNGLTEMRILPGNVRYLRISGFEWIEDQTGAAYDAAMRFLRDGDAVIIDLRDNGGGSHSAVRYLLSHFMDGDQLDMTFLETGQEPIQSRTLENLPAGRLKGKPLYILTNKRVGSAAEAFAYDVQQFHLGTLVGEVTAGAANNNEFWPIAPGFMLSCSHGRPVHPISKSNWEGVGVKPDVASTAETALDVAHSLALATLLARPGSDPADRAAWAWARPAIEARLHPAAALSQTRLRSLAGQYGDQKILWRDGALHYLRRNGQLAPMIMLDQGGLFTVDGLDDQLHVRLDGTTMEIQWIDEPLPTILSRSNP